LVQLVDFGGGDEAEFKFHNGSGVIAKRRGEGIVAEITAAGCDEHKISHAELS